MLSLYGQIYLRATGWDESSSRPRTGDTELTGTERRRESKAPTLSPEDAESNETDTFANHRPADMLQHAQLSDSSSSLSCRT